MSSLTNTFDRLCNLDNRRTEAEIQADVRQFILEAPFQLRDKDLSNVQLESQLGDRRRIDVEVGATVIEVKSDPRSERVRHDAEAQLAGYVAMRGEQTAAAEQIVSAFPVDPKLHFSTTRLHIRDMLEGTAI